MASKEQDKDLDLFDVMLYAPIGFVYEYRKVLPQLVRKGRSQVQLGMFIGRMAASKGGSGAEKVTADALTTMATIAARGITEFGQAVGLAPPDDEAPPIAAELVETGSISETPPSPAKAAKATKAKAAAKPAKATSGKAAKGKTGKSKSTSARSAKPRLPIAGYDDLTAREIVSLLDDLTPAQRKRVREHEAASRNRKTISAKLDRLES